MNGYSIAELYSRGDHCGWAETTHPGIAKQQFDLLRGSFEEFRIVGRPRPRPQSEERKMFLHEVVQAVLGKDIDNNPQEIGDCTSFAGAHCIEYLTALEMAGKAIAQQEMSVGVYLAGARLKWRPAFPPYLYGVGRNLIGGKQIRPSRDNPTGDGALATWIAAAAGKYGVLFSDEPGVPRYSGTLARNWGIDESYFKDFISRAQSYIVKATAPISNWDALCDSVSNGYPVSTASDFGYSMEAGRDGFHIQNSTWSHNMTIIGIDETWKNDPYAIILNNWGDVHGHLKDFLTGDPLPIGVLRVRRKDVEKHLANGENIAYSNFQGFPAQKLDKTLFMLL